MADAVPAHYRHVTSAKLIVQLELAGPTAERAAVLDSLGECGFRVVRSGPYTDESMWPRHDPERFLYVAVKEVDG